MASPPKKCGIRVICYLHETRLGVLFRWDKKEYSNATARWIRAPWVNHSLDRRGSAVAYIGICARSQFPGIQYQWPARDTASLYATAEEPLMVAGIIRRPRRTAAAQALQCHRESVRMALGKPSASRLGGGADTFSRTSKWSSHNGRQPLLTDPITGRTLGCRGHLIRLTDKLGLSVHVDPRHDAGKD